MKNLEDYTIREIKEKIVYFETNGGKTPIKIEILSIGWEEGADMYTYDEDIVHSEDWYEKFTADVIINNSKLPMEYEFSLTDNCICYSRVNKEAMTSNRV